MSPIPSNVPDSPDSLRSRRDLRKMMGQRHRAGEGDLDRREPSDDRGTEEPPGKGSGSAAPSPCLPAYRTPPSALGGEGKGEGWPVRGLLGGKDPTGRTLHPPPRQPGPRSTVPLAFGVPTRPLT